MMNVVDKLVRIANVFDNYGYHISADKLTKIAVEIVDSKEGKKLLHQTRSEYDHPEFMMDPNYAKPPSKFHRFLRSKSTPLALLSEFFSDDYEDPMEELASGFKGDKVGPGYYTTDASEGGFSNKFAPNTRITRNVKLPKGSKILDVWDCPVSDANKIINAINKKFKLKVPLAEGDKNVDLLEYIDQANVFGYDMNSVFRWLNPLLVGLGYDAIKGHVPGVINVINKAAITKPRLFQQERFRPETLSDEQRKELEDAMYTSYGDMEKFVERLKKK